MSYADDDIVIVSAVRTPIGVLQGTLASFPASELGKAVIKEVLIRANNLNPADVSEVIFGQVLTAGAGQNPVRQASIGAGIPVEVPAYGVNMLCGSGLKAIALAFQAIRNGDSKIVVAGGQESMSQAPHCVHMRNGVKYGDAMLVDTLAKDGLQDAFNHYAMGITAENLAITFHITREIQDEFAANSQQKCENAIASGLFHDEIVPIVIKTRSGDKTITEDEGPRKGTTLDSLKKLKPCFITDGTGTVTAGNSSGINDGAAALLLMSAKEARQRGLIPMARIVSWAQAGVEPAIMGTGPIPAVKLALQKASWSLSDVEYFESNEAFAAQSCVVLGELQIPKEKVNIHGGAIALGHPIGASGARVVVTLLSILARQKAHRGVATLCVGGGMGIAMCIEKL